MNFRPSGGGHLLFTSISFVRRLLQRYSFLFFGGCSIRDIPIGPLLQQALLELRKDASDDVFIFASRNGTPLDSHNLLGRVLKSASTIASYVYSLDPAIHPLTVAERGGRSSGGTKRSCELFVRCSREPHATNSSLAGITGGTSASAQGCVGAVWNCPDSLGLTRGGSLHPRFLSRFFQALYSVKFNDIMMITAFAGTIESTCKYNAE